MTSNFPHIFRHWEMMNHHARTHFLYFVMKIYRLDFHQVPMEVLSIIQTIHHQVQMMVTNVIRIRWFGSEHYKIALMKTPIKMPLRSISMRIAPTQIRQTHWLSIRTEMDRVQRQTRQNIKFDMFWWEHNTRGNQMETRKKNNKTTKQTKMIWYFLFVDFLLIFPYIN